MGVEFGVDGDRAAESGEAMLGLARAVVQESGWPHCNTSCCMGVYFVVSVDYRLKALVLRAVKVGAVG